MSSQKTKKAETEKKRKLTSASRQVREAETSTTVIRLSGNLRIDQVAPYQQQLREALTADNRVELVLEEVEQVDLSFVQLVIAARKSAQRLGKSFQVTAELPDEVTVLLKHAGLHPWLVADAPALDHQETSLP